MKKPRVIGVFTVARSDYGIYLPVLRRIRRTPGLKLEIYAAGMHLEKAFGRTVRMIERDGFAVTARVPMGITSDRPVGIACAMGRGIAGCARVLAARKPDLLLVMGDRFDMFAGAAAALPFKIPVAHIHGGEVTEGAIDDSLRHAMTKLSHLHFVATQAYRRRVIQLGEEPWRVIVSGAPGLDNLRAVKLPSARALERRYGLDLSVPSLLVTFHPVTLEFEDAAWHVDQLLRALAKADRPIVFTLPNADTGGRIIRNRIRAFAKHHPRARLVDNLGTEDYFGMMKHAAAMVGNSSSGIIEAASFALPVVNIGNRQRGRLRARNVIDTGYTSAAILAGIRRAVSPGFAKSLRGLVNPYGRGRAAEAIVRTLRTVKIDQRLVMKKFYDTP